MEDTQLLVHLLKYCTQSHNLEDFHEIKPCFSYYLWSHIFSKNHAMYVHSVITSLFSSFHC